MVASPTFEQLIERDFEIAAHAEWPTFDELLTIDIAISREDADALEGGRFAAAEVPQDRRRPRSVRGVSGAIVRATRELVGRLH